MGYDVLLHKVGGGKSSSMQMGIGVQVCTQPSASAFATPHLPYEASQHMQDGCGGLMGTRKNCRLLLTGRGVGQRSMHCHRSRINKVAAPMARKQSPFVRGVWRLGTLARYPKHASTARQCHSVGECHYSL